MKRDNYYLFILIIIPILFLLFTKIEIRQIIKKETPEYRKLPEYRKSPEFRNPPIKEYKPEHIQQMGVLLGENGDTRPLYGKSVRGRRDRFHYYTTTSGEQIYPLPITHSGRDCTEDIGCNELYDNETIKIIGKDQEYKTKLYRTDNFF